MPSRHDYGREAAGRARLRFNRLHPLLSTKESPGRMKEELDNEVILIDPGEHYPLKRTGTSNETTKAFGVGNSEDSFERIHNFNKYLEVHVPARKDDPDTTWTEEKCGMFYPHQIHIEREMTDLTCTTTSMSTFDNGDDAKLAGEDNRDFSQNNQVQLKMYSVSEANVLTAKSYNPRHMQDLTINESDKSGIISTQHISNRNSSQHQYDQMNKLKDGALVKSPSEPEFDTYDDDDDDYDDDDDDDYDDNDYYDSVTLMESRTHSYQRTISGTSKSKKLSLFSDIGVEVGSDFKSDQLSSPPNISCSLTSIFGDIIDEITPTRDKASRNSLTPTRDKASRNSPFDTIRKFVCDPSSVLYSGREQDNRNVNLSVGL